MKPLILPAKDFVALTEQAATFDPPNNSAINLIERVNRFNAMLVELRRTSITDKQMVADYVRPLRMGITSWVSDPDQWGATTVKFKPRRPNGRGRPVQ